MEENKKTFLSNPGGWLSFIFGMSVLVTWATFQGLFQREVYLLSGCMMLATFPLYIVGAGVYAKIGEALISSMYYIFGTLFGGIFGLSYIALFFGYLKEWNLDETVLALPMIIGGIFILPSVMSLRHYAIVPFITYLIVAIWLIVGGLSMFGIGGYFLYLINTYCALVVGVLVIYLGMGEVQASAGLKEFPIGKRHIKA